MKFVLREMGMESGYNRLRNFVIQILQLQLLSLNDFIESFIDHFLIGDCIIMLKSNSILIFYIIVLNSFNIINFYPEPMREYKI